VLSVVAVALPTAAHTVRWWVPLMCLTCLTYECHLRVSLKVVVCSLILLPGDADPAPVTLLICVCLLHRDEPKPTVTIINALWP